MSARGARWRVATRLAQRQVRRTWVGSLLIVALVALPIAGATAAAIILQSTLPTKAEEIAVELGQTEAWIEAASAPDPTFWQYPTEPWYFGTDEWSGSEDAGGGGELGTELKTDPSAELPAGTEILTITRGETTIQTQWGVARVNAWAGPLWNDSLEGRSELTGGRGPEDDDEVLVTEATLDRVGEQIGGTLASADGEQFYTIVGTIRISGLSRDSNAVVFYDPARYEMVRWYLPSRALSWDDVQQLNMRGLIVYSREVVTDPPVFTPPNDDWAGSEQTDERLYGLALLAAASVAAGYVVVLLAGAAFAVSARRQQRTLAITASVGAAHGDIRRTVWLQGAVLGAVGGVAGIVLGIPAATAVIAATDDGSRMRYWGFHVPWDVIAAIFVFATVVGIVSALMPARSVAKTDTISSLRGARRPQKVRVSRPLWGLFLLAGGAAITVLCGIATGVIAVSDTIAYDSVLRSAPQIGIVVGAIIAQLGIVLSGRWLLWVASLLLSKIGLGARLASRDAVANGARTVPAFAAIGATVFVAVFATATGTMLAATQAREWLYVVPEGKPFAEISQGLGRLTPESARAAVESGTELLTSVGATRVAEISAQQSVFGVGSVEEISATATRAVAILPDALRAEAYELGWDSDNDPTNNIAVVEADDVEVWLGATLTAAQRSAFEAGSALVLNEGLITDGTITIAAWSERDFYEGTADVAVTQTSGASDVPEPTWSREWEAVALDSSVGRWSVILPPDVARELDITALPALLVGDVDQALGADARDRLWEVSAGLSGDEFYLWASVAEGPPSPAVWLVPLLGGVAVLVLGASAIALGLARFERRPDDATLSAVGGTALLRRNVGFWQGLLIAGFGTFAGAVAGILPPIGFWIADQATAWQEPQRLSDIPWWLLAALVIGLPLAIAVINWLVPPRAPDLTRRTAIA